MRRIAFVHGFLGSPDMWGEVGRHLPDIDAVCNYLPGHGPAPFTMSGSFEQIVDAWAQSLPSDVTSFVGYSMGARVVLSLASRYPERVSRAVLIGVHPGFTSDADRTARAHEDDVLASRVLSAGLETFVNEWENLPLFATQRHLSDAQQSARRRERLSHTKEGVAWTLRHLGLAQMDYYDAAPIQEKLLLVTGEHDAKFCAIARTVHTRHVIVSGAGHDVALEALRNLQSTYDSILD